MSIKKTTWHHIRRSPLQSLAALIIVFFTALLFILFYLVSSGLSKTLTYFETKPEITIFLKDGLSKDQVQAIQTDLSLYPEIRQIRFISKEKALDIYQDQNKDNPLLLEMVTSDILPASFEVSANNPQTLEQIENDFKTRTDVVDELIYQKDVISNLLVWTQRIRLSALIFVSLFSFVSFLVIFTIIGMKITNRKDEIRISRLLGASKSYVKKPFIMEAVFYGLAGSLLANLIILPLTYFFKADVNNYFQPIEFIKLDYIHIIQIVTVSTFLSITLTYLASILSVKRYFKF